VLRVRTRRDEGISPPRPGERAARAWPGEDSPATEMPTWATSHHSAPRPSERAARAWPRAGLSYNKVPALGEEPPVSARRGVRGRKGLSPRPKWQAASARAGVGHSPEGQARGDEPSLPGRRRARGGMRVGFPGHGDDARIEGGATRIILPGGHALLLDGTGHAPPRDRPCATAGPVIATTRVRWASDVQESLLVLGGVGPR
jgi:hypothetical protein